MKGEAEVFGERTMSSDKSTAPPGLPENVMRMAQRVHWVAGIFLWIVKTAAVAGALWIIGVGWWSWRDAHDISYPPDRVAAAVAIDECSSIVEQSARIACYDGRFHDVILKAPFDTTSAFWALRDFYLTLILGPPVVVVGALFFLWIIINVANNTLLRVSLLRAAAESGEPQA